MLCYYVLEELLIKGLEVSAENTQLKTQYINLCHLSDTNSSRLVEGSDHVYFNPSY